MERIVICDTETTGMPVRDGHRIIEIAGVEIIDRKVTGKTFQRFINPQRLIDPAAMAVHGITDEELVDKPLFGEVMDDFLEFVSGSIFIAHNSRFDEEFINEEMIRANSPRTFWEYVKKCVDTLHLSKQIHGNKGRHNLDALLDRLEIDRTSRTKHGALIDCELLAKAYLKMTDGLDLSGPTLEDDVIRKPIEFINRENLGGLVVRRASRLDEQTHEAYLDGLEEQNKTSTVIRRTKI